VALFQPSREHVTEPTVPAKAKTNVGFEGTAWRSSSFFFRLAPWIVGQKLNKISFMCAPAEQ
jgi:hypothetical protein